MKTHQLSYDCAIFLTKYIGGEPMDMQLYEDNSFYEIARGLQSAQVNLSINGLGKATIRLTLPIKGQGDTDDDVLIRWIAKDADILNLVNNPNPDDSYLSFNIKERERKGIPGILDTDKIQKYEPILNSTHTECFFQPMDKVKIFMTNRFQENKSVPKYSQVFEGLLSTCSVNYANGRIVVTLQADDNLKWLANSIYTINQAMDNNTLLSIKTSEISHLSNNLQGMNIVDIVKKMILGDESESWVELDETQYYKFVKLYGYSKIASTDGTLKAVYKHTDSEGNISYRFRLPNSVGAGVFTLARKGKGDSVNERTSVIRGLNFNDNLLFIDNELGTFQGFAERMNNFSLFDHQYKTRLQVCKEVADMAEAEFYCDREGDIIFKAPDYNSNPGFSPDMKAYGQSASDDYAKGFLNADQYLIEDSEIINYNSIVSDKNIKTYLYLNGSVDFITDNVAKMNTTPAFRLGLIKRFGVRMFEKTVPILGFEENETARVANADGLLNRKNSEINQISISIPLRPELRLARTFMMIGNLIQDIFKINEFNPYKNDIVKLSDTINSVLLNKRIHYKDYFANSNPTITNKIKSMHLPTFYISGIKHNWTAGQQCTTTIMGTHGRSADTKFGKLEFLRVYDIPPKAKKQMDK